MSNPPEHAARPAEHAGFARGSWYEFYGAIAEHRPALFRFCRHLTRSPWDAEDLVQDTLARAFVTLQYSKGIEHPRAWMLRVASNLWIDRVRRAREEPAGMLRDEPTADAGADPRATREAAGTLIARLSPQERVALVLKEAFELPLDEIAAVLGTTTGAIKAALHRGRDKLAAAPEPEPARVPVPAALDAFVAAFNAGDLAAVIATLLDSAIVEMPGLVIDVGVAATSDPTAGILHHTVTSPLSAGVAAAFLDDYLPARPRAELRLHRGEHLVLLWYAHRGGDAVRCFVRFELTPEGDRIAAMREHFFAPEALAELAGELGVPYRSNGYGVEAVEV